MPELPEVETVRRVLLPHRQNKKIIKVQIHNPQVLVTPRPEAFVACVQGQTISDFTRRGKFLRLLFDSGDYLTIHLRMTGCLIIEPQITTVQKHTHITFTLDDGNELRYDDVRRLGKLWFAKNGEEDMSGKKKLGIEPFDNALDAAYLQDKFQNSKKSIKTMLLDQSIVTGIGNIYSDEILFSAGIRPDKPCRTLTDGEYERLAATIPQCLAYFVEKNTIDFEEYMLKKGKYYRNTPYLQVYGKGGKPCSVCGKPLQRVVIGGRSSIFCPHCQK